MMCHDVSKCTTLLDTAHAHTHEKVLILTSDYLIVIDTWVWVISLLYVGVHRSTRYNVLSSDANKSHTNPVGYQPQQLLVELMAPQMYHKHDGFFSVT